MRAVGGRQKNHSSILKIIFVVSIAIFQGSTVRAQGVPKETGEKTEPRVVVGASNNGGVMQKLNENQTFTFVVPASQPPISSSTVFDIIVTDPGGVQSVNAGVTAIRACSNNAGMTIDSNTVNLATQEQKSTTFPNGNVAGGILFMMGPFSRASLPVHKLTCPSGDFEVITGLTVTVSAINFSNKTRNSIYSIDYATNPSFVGR